MWNLWKFIPDAVFTSEDYGDTWAEELSKLSHVLMDSECVPKTVKHVLVDKARQDIPVSGTQVRENPLSVWKYLPSLVRELYAHKICIVGGESTGKSTLVETLVEEFGGAHTTEAGRTFVELHGADQNNSAIWPYINREQPRLERVASAHSDNGLVFCDTDLLTTCVWMDAWAPDSPYYRKLLYDAVQHAKTYKEYILLSHEGVPWVDDGTRSEATKREWFTENIEKLLIKHTLSYTKFDGSFQERESAVITHLKNTIPC